MQCEPDDVVALRHPFLQNAGWRVLRSMPSLDPSIILYRCQLLHDDGTERVPVKPITVGESFIKQKLGRFPTWRQQIGSKN